MKGIIIVLAASLLWLTACAQEAGSTTSSAQTEGVAVKRVSKTEFTKILKANPDAVLIDVRTPREYNAGKIDDAQNIDFNDDSFTTKISALDKNKLTLIYCQSGGRSGKALSQMREMGFTDVRELEGGYSGW